MKDVKLGKLIKILSSSMEKEANKVLKQYDLSFTQGLALMWLGEEADNIMAIKKMEKRFGTAQSTVFGVITRLEAKGLIETFIKDHKKYVKLTQSGVKLSAPLQQSLDEIDMRFFNGFTGEEQELFFEFLIRAVENFSDINIIDE